MSIPDVDFYSLQVFLMVCQQKSFAKAARKLFLSEPAVSMRIRALEQRLGVQLFQRGHYGVRLTPAATLLQDPAARVLDLFSQAASEARAIGSAVTSHVTMWCAPTTLAYLLPNLVTRFSDRQPEVELVARSGRPELVLTELVAGELDCAIVASKDKPSIGGFEVHELFRDIVGMVVPPSHVLAQQATVSLHDLACERILCWERAGGYWPQVKQALEGSPAKLRNLLSVESLEALKELTKRGVGVAFFPQVIVVEDVRRGELVFRPFQVAADTNMEIRTWLCYSKKHALAVKLVGLEEVLQGCSAELQQRLDAGIKQARSPLLLS
jgi:DNA-binding transcriptional LysR family regulator